MDGISLQNSDQICGENEYRDDYGEEIVGPPPSQSTERWSFSSHVGQIRPRNSYEADACIERYGLKTVRYDAQVKHPHMPVRMWKDRPVITVCAVQNPWGIWNGFILHIMPSQLEKNSR